MLYPVGKQVYKLKLPKKLKIHDVFYIFLLEQNLTKKEQVNNIWQKFEADNNKKYEVDDILDSAIYIRESERQLPGLYHIVLWKSYSEKKNI